MSKGREHLPSPVKQHILWSSPLIGMERPVRSFKSFIRTVPPNPGIQHQKPLPPLPPSLTIPQGETPVQSLLRPTDEGNLAAWQTPTEWDWDIATPHAQTFNTTSISPNQNCRPLLPEPSPGPYDIHDDMFADVVNAYDMQRDPLKPGYRAMEMRPEPPPRNPSRLSISVRESRLSGSDSSATSVPNDNQSSLSPSIYSETYVDLPKESQVGVRTWEYPSYRASDAATKAKAFASLGIGSPRNSNTVWEGWANRPDASQADEDGLPLMVLRGKDPQPIVEDDSSASSQAVSAVSDDKLAQLSFSQDYHNVLAHQYNKDYPQTVEMLIHPALRTTLSRTGLTARPQPSQREQEMVPQPLAWSKSSGSSFSSTYSQRRPSETAVITMSAPKGMHKKMPSWIPLQHFYGSGSGRTQQGYPSHFDPENAISQHTSKSTPPNKLNRLDNFLAHAKGLGHRRIRSGTGTPTTPAPDFSQQSFRPSTDPAMAHPLQPTTMLQRLPKGSALAPNLSSDMPRPDSPTQSNISPFTDTRLPNLYTDLPFLTSSGFRRPSSLYSQPSPASPVAPGMAINGRFRNSIGSLPSSRRQSHTSSNAHTPSQPTSPLAMEVFPPRSPPPPLPTKLPRSYQVSPTSSPIPTGGGRRQFETFFGDKTRENSPQKSGFWDKAKDVRATWKRNQKEAKHEKLKQSIRVVVPVETLSVERRSNRKASIFGGSGIDRRIPVSEYAALNVI
ncbi:hypothetical protein NX059_003747 [Plenodomus lindquistii]|nr:hypothetical protein NX059_003747 [Plenodomus lindquistii]